VYPGRTRTLHGILTDELCHPHFGGVDIVTGFFFLDYDVQARTQAGT